MNWAQYITQRDTVSVLDKLLDPQVVRILRPSDNHDREKEEEDNESLGLVGLQRTLPGGKMIPLRYRRCYWRPKDQDKLRHAKVEVELEKVFAPWSLTCAHQQELSSTLRTNKSAETPDENDIDLVKYICETVVENHPGFKQEHEFDLAKWRAAWVNLKHLSITQWQNILDSSRGKSCADFILDTVVPNVISQSKEEACASMTLAKSALLRSSHMDCPISEFSQQLLDLQLHKVGPIGVAILRKLASLRTT